ncbi:unnamed protein product [Candidula unifasciata]|uniref:N-glycosylase/DNA lyase n=1 Tax=Candidula unifasciata TaxID=100452 RepID=A0A8S3YUY2_9EUPU|nr:unnamed protein product [Candidula unifasciata]
MSTTTGSVWRKFMCSRSQLCLDTVLAAGQSFRWKKNGSGEWVGVMSDLVWRLRQTEEAILYHVYGSETLLNQASNSSLRFPDIKESNNFPAVELPVRAVNSKVKQEIESSEVQLASESAQKTSEVKSFTSILNGNYGQEIKLECFEDSEEAKILQCDKLRAEGLKVFTGNNSQDGRIRVKECSKFREKGMEMVTCNEEQAKEINDDKSQPQEKHKNGSRKSKRVVERMTAVENKWGTENTVVPSGEASAKTLCLRKRATKKVVETSSTIQHISLKQNERGKNETDLLQAEASDDKTLRLRKSTTSKILETHSSAAEIAETNFTAQQIPVDPIMKTGDVDEPGKDDLHHKLLEDYFQTSVDLDHLYQHWSSKDPHFQKVAKNFQGVRLLRQDPTECLLSFVCSSNNHISRISSMVEKLCTYYGNLITSVDGVAYYTFPHLSDLCGDHVESHLRELGFGYRAKFIASIARHVTQDKGQGWLDSLRQSPYLQAKTELLTLLGVGAKVADCVCLMSLDKPQALPVDTHVWQFTAKNYMPKLHGAKSLTEKLYTEIGDFFRDLWGSYAGWAQAVLFAADLRHNKVKVDGQEGSPNKKRKAYSEAGIQKLHRRKQNGKRNQTQ